MFVPGKPCYLSQILEVKALRAYSIMERLEGAFLRLAPCLTCKHWARLEKLASDKHTGLLRKFVNYGRKKFYYMGPGKSY